MAVRDLGFVAVARNTTANANYVRRTTDGATWSVVTEGTATDWRSVCYGNGLFVAISRSGTLSGGKIHTSPDGVTWTRVTVPDKAWNSVCYGGGQFVAVSSESVDVLTSADGATWTSRTASNAMHAVCYGNGLYVGVGIFSSGGKRVCISADGITWSNQSSAIQLWLSVCYGNGLFVAGGNSGIMTSPDGVTWTSQTPSSSGGAWWGVCWDDTLGLFVAVGNAGSTDRIMSSPDGVTWTGHGNATVGWESVASNGERYVAVGAGGAYAYSTDGTTWTTGTSGAEFWRGITHGYIDITGGIYVDGAVHF
mgnify:CR=1 FL=1